MPEPRALTHSPESPDDKLKRLCEQVAEQAALIEQLRERIRELEARLAKDSHNSSRSPSGVTRSLVDDPDRCVIIPLTGTCACGRCGTGIAATVLAERRQVVEVEIQRKVHRVPHCRRNLCLWARATQHVSCRD